MSKNGGKLLGFDQMKKKQRGEKNLNILAIDEERKNYVQVKQV